MVVIAGSRVHGAMAVAASEHWGGATAAVKRGQARPSAAPAVDGGGRDSCRRVAPGVIIAPMMNLLTREIRWSTWEFGLAKIGFILMGIIIGALMPELWQPVIAVLAVLMVAALFWPVTVWLRGFREP
jgi:hypothetical protein